MLKINQKQLFMYGLATLLSLGSIVASAQKKTANYIKPDLKIKKGLSDDQLLDLVQKQTFRYFWDFAHPKSGMARERSNLQSVNSLPASRPLHTPRRL
jgi:hypothetical protein